jgi:hypothetical protein
MTITADSSETTPDTTIDIVEPNWPATERSPVQLFALAVAGTVFLLALLISVLDETALVGFEADLVRFFAELPDGFERFLVGMSQFVAILYPVALVVAFFIVRRWRAVLTALAAWFLAVALMWALGGGM